MVCNRLPDGSLSLSLFDISQGCVTAACCTNCRVLSAENKKQPNKRYTPSKIYCKDIRHITL